MSRTQVETPAFCAGTLASFWLLLVHDSEGSVGRGDVPGLCSRARAAMLSHPEHEAAVFAPRGCSLTSCVDLPQSSGQPVPVVVESCVRFINLHGETARGHVSLVSPGSLTSRCPLCCRAAPRGHFQGSWFPEGHQPAPRRL